MDLKCYYYFLFMHLLIKFYSYKLKYLKNNNKELSLETKLRNIIIKIIFIFYKKVINRFINFIEIQLIKSV